MYISQYVGLKVSCHAQSWTDERPGAGTAVVPSGRGQLELLVAANADVRTCSNSQNAERKQR